MADSPEEEEAVAAILLIRRMRKKKSRKAPFEWVLFSTHLLLDLFLDIPCSFYRTSMGIFEQPQLKTLLLLNRIC